MKITVSMASATTAVGRESPSKPGVQDFAGGGGGTWAYIARNRTASGRDDRRMTAKAVLEEVFSGVLVFSDEEGGRR